LILTNKAAPAPITHPGYNREKASSLYLELAMAGPTMRRAEYRTLSGEEKTLVWLEHFALFEENRTLTPAQQRFIAGLMKIISDKDMDRDREMIKGLVANSRLAEQAIALFEKRGTAELIIYLGSEIKDPAINREALQTLNALSLCVCTIQTSFNECGDSSSCRGGAGEVCGRSNWGCGILWLQQCDGMCRSDLEIEATKMKLPHK
jgi:hypothetical protein